MSPESLTWARAFFCEPRDLALGWEWSRRESGHLGLGKFACLLGEHVACGLFSKPSLVCC